MCDVVRQFKWYTIQSNFCDFTDMTDNNDCHSTQDNEERCKSMHDDTTITPTDWPIDQPISRIAFLISPIFFVSFGERGNELNEFEWTIIHNSLHFKTFLLFKFLLNSSTTLYAISTDQSTLQAGNATADCASEKKRGDFVVQIPCHRKNSTINHELMQCKDDNEGTITRQFWRNGKDKWSAQFQ